MRYILRVEYYSEIKINKLSYQYMQNHIRFNMESNTILRERDKPPKCILHHFFYINVKRYKISLQYKKSGWWLPLERRKEGVNKRGSF